MGAVTGDRRRGHAPLWLTLCASLLTAAVYLFYKGDDRLSSVMAVVAHLDAAVACWRIVRWLIPPPVSA